MTHRMAFALLVSVLFALGAYVPSVRAEDASPPDGAARPAAASVSPNQQYGPVGPVDQLVPSVPGALPPGLYRAGAMPAPPPAFYDMRYYYGQYANPYAPYGNPYAGYAGTTWGSGPTFTHGFVAPSPSELAQAAQIPYDTAIRDAQRYHYLNQFIQRDQALLRQNVDQTRLGLAVFRTGRYEQAAVKYLNAAAANHGDAASRIHAGHALFALGRYDEAMKLIRRAMQLQPRLTTEDYDVRDDYGDREDFTHHLAALEYHVTTYPNDAAGVLMLGYIRYYTTGPGSAYESLVKAKALDPRNDLIDKLLAVSSKVYSPGLNAPPIAPGAAARPSEPLVPTRGFTAEPVAPSGSAPRTNASTRRG